MKSTILHGVNLICTIAKHQSLTSAAKDLNLTVGAVSQQLQQVEQKLGFSVFERHARGIRLTEQGAKLVDGTAHHLAAIEDNVFQITQVSERKQIRLKLTPSFAFKWLVPRLEKFHRQYPDVQIHTIAEGALVDSDKRNFDIAIDYGPLPYKHPDAELILAESLLPVMSRDYFNQHASIVEGGEAWSQVTLLHDMMPWQGASKDHEWRFWVAAHKFDFATHQGHFFNRTDMAMSAAEAGVGIALARVALLGNEIEQQRLVAPFAPISANAGYFVITHTEDPYTRLFKQWLRQQVENERGESKS
ncbi:LysR substrate-binding domain-containing protein [Vibrio sinaloensis]|uniref:LysR substrate-binding domain-containing protein n=1 Tax=Photobacterium sp. (strain ATCC 43367) TaxID=379097 RepID=UPI0020512555|nr:LysR substrate-binding domain-containing protein [Vibrio sinaloensis]UPQ87384.1 LysR substrate-binding domain-containing protein [Vibrio sinaloensis]